MISKKYSTGFTIIETLMAVLVLSIAIAGALALATKGLDALVTARQEVNAVYLAQDAMEYLRATRDTNCLAVNNGIPPASCTNATWLGTSPTNVGALCGGVAGCYIDTVAGSVTTCSGGCPVLQYDSTTMIYTYSGLSATPTIFTRAVYIQTPIGGNADEASTTVLVSWPGAGGITRSIRIHDDLYNWQ